jgi:flagellar motor protein MotB
MPSRFSSPTDRRAARDGNGLRTDGIGEWWAAIAVIALAAIAVISLTGSIEPRSARTGADAPADPTPQLLAPLEPAQASLDAVEAAFRSLCGEPVLVALELEPDCETGVISIGDALFDGYGSAQLGPVAQEDVAAAMTTYLRRLRRLPAIWDNLEAIEIRGHTDPRAVRDPYVTNMVGSYDRALGVLLFLVGPDGLSDDDREELERLAIVSGASFSRPPESCPEESRECYEDWRRVEIRPVLSESRRREDWSRSIQEIRALQASATDGTTD